LKKITMPRVDPAMEWGRIVEWLKKEGESVREGEAVAVVEGEKTTFEIHSPADGVLEKILRNVGEEVGVGESLAIVQEAGAKEEAVLEERTRASPAARRLAKEHGIDLTTVKPTGPEGTVTKEDVMMVIETLKKETEVRPGRVIKLEGIRRAIATRLSHSFHTSVPVTLMTEFDADRLQAAVKEAKAKGISFTAVIIKATAKALSEDSTLNAIWENDMIVQKDEINIAVAIDTPQGLYAPVIKNANTKSLAEISSELSELRRKALESNLSPEDLKGHTFTVSNLGAEGVTFFTPVINPPAVAILGFGTIDEKPVVRQGAVVAGKVGALSLVFDHRAVDGAPAASFLRRLRRIIEESGWQNPAAAASYQT